MKRWLYLLHRWAGIALCIVMALWFFSGVVMMYVGYPKLTPQERLQHLPALALEGCCVPPQTAIAAVGLKTAPDDLRLAMVAGAPAYLVRSGRDNWSAVDARSGSLRAKVDDALALASARQFAGGSAVRHLGLVQEDAWTNSRALDPHRPLHLVEIDDPAHTQVYISSRTGEVVRDSSRTERVWNYAGAWLHWLYMFRGNWFDPAWHNIVVYSSLAGTLMSIVGIWIGVLRVRWKGVYRKGGSHIPYREFWMRWHLILGLVFSVATVLWIFSGLMSMNPWKVFTSAHANASAVAFAGGKLEARAFTVTPQAALARAQSELPEVKELQWHWAEGRPWILAYDAHGRSRAIAGGMPNAGTAPHMQTLFDFEALASAAARAMPHAKMVRWEVLREYDLWHYDRAPHTMLGHVERRLPMLRAHFDDPGATMLHVDPYTASIHNRIDNHGRWKRWLFTAFHSWDLRGLINRRPLWDILMIGFSLGGFALCITSAVIAWRRLKRYGRTIQSKAAPASPPAQAQLG